MTGHEIATLWEKIGKLEAATAMNTKLIYFIIALLVAGVGADVVFHSNIRDDITLVGSIFIAFTAGTGFMWFLRRNANGKRS